MWDLRYERTEEVKLRTRPLENPHVPIPDKGWRQLQDGGRFALLAPPGTYTVRLTIGERTFNQPLQVLKDPGSAGSEGDIRQQMTVLLDLRNLLNESAHMINELEWARKQLYDLMARYEDRPEEEEIATAAHELDQQLMELEGQFFDLRLTDAGQDTLRWKRLLYARLGDLARRIGSSDFPPTDPQRQVYLELKEQHVAHRQRFEKLQREVVTFSEMLREQGVAAVVLGE
jgi:hypothetical protein